MKVRYYLISLSLAIWLLFIVLTGIIARPIVRHVVRSTIKMKTLSVLNRVRKTHNIASVIEDLKKQGESRSINFILLDAKGNKLYACSKKFNINLKKAMTKSVHVSNNEDIYFATRYFDLNKERFILVSVMDASFINELIRNMQFTIIFFTSMIVLIGILISYMITQKVVLHPLSQIMSVLVPFFTKKIAQPISLTNEFDSEEFKQLKNAWNLMVQREEELDNFLVAEREEKQAILDVLEEGIIVIDRDNIVSYINLKAIKMLHLLSVHFIGESIEELIKKNSSKLGHSMLEVIEVARRDETTIKDAVEIGSDTKIYYDIIANCAPRTRSVIIMLQDRSSDHKIVDIGKNFVANASHELRTPITIIKGFTETLRELPDLSSSMLEDITEKILRNCQRMTSLVKNLLVLADLDYCMRDNLQGCDLVGLVESCSFTLLSLHPDIRIETLQNKSEIEILGDPDLLELALMNLLENAVKYAQNHTIITITVEEKTNQISLSITDNGIGIDKQDLKHVFDRFYTVNKSRSRKLGGAGLGLSIVKAIVEKHRGKVFVDSKVNLGTTFELTFPIFKDLTYSSV